MAGARAMVTAGAGASPKDTSTLMRVRDGTSGAPSLRSERTLAVDALSRRMRRSEHAGQISFSFSVFLSEAHSAFPARKAAQGVGLACEFQRIGVHVCDTAQGRGRIVALPPTPKTAESPARRGAHHPRTQIKKTMSVLFIHLPFSFSFESCKSKSSRRDKQNIKQVFSFNN